VDAFGCGIDVGRRARRDRLTEPHSGPGSGRGALLPAR
jgi:hypothetical protein